MPALLFVIPLSLFILSIVCAVIRKTDFDQKQSNEEQMKYISNYRKNNAAKR